MKFKQRTLNQLADLICGNFDQDTSWFPYRSSSYLTEFFQDCDTDYVHDGTTRAFWVATVLSEILDEPHESPHVPPHKFQKVIQTLMDRSDAVNEGVDRSNALSELNKILAREGFEAFYGEDYICYLRHISTQTVATSLANPYRPLSKEEKEKQTTLATYLDNASEDELIQNILLPLYRQLGFQRVRATDHKDKTLEYGKDLWMKYKLPTMHQLYFGVQVKRGKLDATGKSKNTNVTEVLAQIRMMLGHPIFDAEQNKKVLVDHAIIVCGGEITKQAKNWLGLQLDASDRSQILFMDREDILDLYVVYNAPLPVCITHENDTKVDTNSLDDNIPF